MSINKSNFIVNFVIRAFVDLPDDLTLPAVKRGRKRVTDEVVLEDANLPGVTVPGRQKKAFKAHFSGRIDSQVTLIAQLAPEGILVPRLPPPPLPLAKTDCNIRKTITNYISKIKVI